MKKDAKVSDIKQTTVLLACDFEELLTKVPLLDFTQLERLSRVVRVETASRDMYLDLNNAFQGVGGAGLSDLESIRKAGLLWDVIEACAHNGLVLRAEKVRPAP